METRQSRNGAPNAQRRRIITITTFIRTITIITTTSQQTMGPVLSTHYASHQILLRIPILRTIRRIITIITMRIRAIIIITHHDLRRIRESRQ